MLSWQCSEINWKESGQNWAQSYFIQNLSYYLLSSVHMAIGPSAIRTMVKWRSIIRTPIMWPIAISTRAIWHSTILTPAMWPGNIRTPTFHTRVNCAEYNFVLDQWCCRALEAKLDKNKLFLIVWVIKSYFATGRLSCSDCQIKHILLHGNKLAFQNMVNLV